MHFKKIIALSILVLSLSFFANAQVTTSAITGFVKDSKGEALVGASIKATHEPTGKVYTSVTRTGGRFDINNMIPGGPYNIEVSFVGQNIPKKTDVILQLGNTENLDFAASETATELQTVVVTGGRARTVKNGTSTNINQKIISSLPNISRSITNLTTLTPQAGAGGSFGGRDGRYNNIQIDGASFNNNFGLSTNPLPGGAVSPISLDAIDEISVNVSPFDVRQANFTGAGINATTKRGTNRFTGSVYGFYRHDGFIGRKANGKDIPSVVNSNSKIFGGRLGGPIIKNKLFFFLSAETEKTEAPGIVWKATRPGSTTDANTSRVRASALDSVSDYLRSKNGYETGPYENLGNFNTENKKFLGRLDWNITQKHTASLRYNYSKTDDDQLLNGNSAPNPRSASNRWSNNSMSYENSNYANTNILSSYSFEVKSNFTNKISNQFIATYTKANDPKRSSKSGIFPFIDILEGGDAYISAGYELFSYNNDVQNNTLTFNNNFTYTAGKHSITAGAAYEKIYVKNQFLRYGTSYYRFASVNDFVTNKAPIAFALTYPYAGQKPFVELDFAQAGLYAQDELSLNRNLKLTFGLRIDRPLFQNKLTENPSIEALTFGDLNNQSLKLNVGNWPKERNYFSPRIGVNWDAYGDKSLIVRGGAGIFTGRFPFVWFTNQPTNSGVIQNTVERVGAQAAPFLFNADPFHYIDSFPSQPGTTAPGSLAIVDPNFKMPQVWRTSAAVDKKLGKDWTITVEGIFNKDINALLQYNANQKAPIGTTFGAGSRPLFGNSNATRRYNTSISEAMVLTNSNKGWAGILTVQVAKRINKNGDFSIAYTHTESSDLSGNPGSQASSAWSNIPSIKGNNRLELANSDFGSPNRVVAYASYKFNYTKFLATTVSLVYTGYEQFRYSYRYSNDFNQDGISSDLIYIPASPSEITFVQNGAFTPQQQSEAFFAFIKNDKYLSKNQGKFALRNGAKMPWFSNLDLRVLQDIMPYSKDRRYGLQLSMEVENFTNMVNNDWGVTRSLVYNNGAILAVASAPTTTSAGTFRMNLVNGQLPTSPYISNITAANTWRMNLGVRLSF